MAEYQNLFTAVQPVGPAHMGVPLGKSDFLGPHGAEKMQQL